MTAAARLTPKASLVLTLCWVAILAATGATDALLFLAPALLLILPLLAGRYLGVELIVEFARRTRRSRPRPARGAARPQAPRSWVPRGTRLIASGLAKRPPPAALLPQT
jgi:hypothetical protein